MKVKGYKNKKERLRRAVWDTGQVCSRAWPSFGDLYLSLMGGEMAAVGGKQRSSFQKDLSEQRCFGDAVMPGRGAFCHLSDHSTALAPEVQGKSVRLQHVSTQEQLQEG